MLLVNDQNKYKHLMAEKEKVLKDYSQRVCFFQRAILRVLERQNSPTPGESPARFGAVRGGCSGPGHVQVPRAPQGRPCAEPRGFMPLAVAPSGSPSPAAEAVAASCRPE